MKPFKINRDSWHYKLNKHFMNPRGDDGWYMQNWWELKHNNFCSYWRVTMFRSAFALFALATISMLLFGLGQVVYQNPWDSFVVIGTVVGIVATFVATIVIAVTISEFSKKRKLKKEDVPDSLFVAKYKAYKSKVCPMVEYDK